MKNEEFRIEDFLITEHDQSGRSPPVYFRIPPLLANDVENALHSGKLPFRTKEEVYRWALCVGIHTFKNGLFESAEALGAHEQETGHGEHQDLGGTEARQ